MFRERREAAMRKIMILPFDHSKDCYKSRGFLIDSHISIRSDGDAVYLAEVVPTELPDVYRAKDRFNSIQVARGGKSTAYLKHVVARLKTMTAYELLTAHYDNIADGQFDVMRQKAK